MVDDIEVYRCVSTQTDPVTSDEENEDVEYAELKWVYFLKNLRN